MQRRKERHRAERRFRRLVECRKARKNTSAAAREREKETATEREERVERGKERASGASERAFSLALTQQRRAMHLSWRTHCETGSVSLADTHTQSPLLSHRRHTLVAPRARTHAPLHAPRCEHSGTVQSSVKSCHIYDFGNAQDGGGTGCSVSRQRATCAHGAIRAPVSNLNEQSLIRAASTGAQGQFKTGGATM